MSESKDDKYICVMAQYLKEIEQKEKDSEYYRGSADGMEYVIDSLENVFKGADDE